MIKTSLFLVLLFVIFGNGYPIGEEKKKIRDETVISRNAMVSTTSNYATDGLIFYFLF